MRRRRSTRKVQQSVEAVENGDSKENGNYEENEVKKLEEKQPNNNVGKISESVSSDVLNEDRDSEENENDDAEKVENMEENNSNSEGERTPDLPSAADHDNDDDGVDREDRDHEIDNIEKIEENSSKSEAIKISELSSTDADHDVEEEGNKEDENHEVKKVENTEEQSPKSEAVKISELSSMDVDHEDEDQSSSSDDDSDAEETPEEENGLSAYERLRLERIKKNEERLAKLGLAALKPFKEPPKKVTKKRPEPEKTDLPPPRRMPGRSSRPTKFYDETPLSGLKRRYDGSPATRHEKKEIIPDDRILAQVGDREIKVTLLIPEAKCSVCSEIAGTERDRRMTQCCRCDKHYHFACHSPPLKQRPRTNWMCATCKEEIKELRREEKEARRATTPKVSRVPAEENTDLYHGEHDNICYICCEGGDLLCCDYCHKAFHMLCHIPPLLEIPKGNWKCCECTAKERTRFFRCGECPACMRKDCGKCEFCLDKPKFGGANIKKQVCVKRVCPYKRLASPNLTMGKYTPAEMRKKAEEAFRSANKSVNRSANSSAKSKKANSTNAVEKQSKPKKHSKKTKNKEGDDESHNINSVLQDEHDSKIKKEAKENAESPLKSSKKHQTRIKKEKKNDIPKTPKKHHSRTGDVKVEPPSKSPLKRKGGSNEDTETMDSKSPSKLFKTHNLRNKDAKVETPLNPSNDRDESSKSAKKMTRSKSSVVKKKRKQREISDIEEEKEDFALHSSSTSVPLIAELTKVRLPKHLQGDPVSKKIRTIINGALKHPENSKIQDKACENLRKLVNSPEDVTRVIELGGLQMISKAMTEHPDKSILQAEACAALAEFAWVNTAKNIVKIIASNGCLGLIVVAMERHDTHIKLQQMAVGAFRTLSYEAENFKYIKKANGVDAVLSSMKKNWKRVEILKEGCICLQNLLCIRKIYYYVARRVLESQILPKVVDGISLHAKSIDFMEVACGFVRNLANDKNIKTNVGNYDSVFTNIIDLVSPDVQIAVLREACSALRVLSLGNEENAVKIASNGGIDAALSALESSPDDTILLSHVLRLLRDLIFHNARNREANVLRNKGFDIFLCTMRKHLNEAEIVSGICAILRLLRPPETDELALPAAREIINVMKIYQTDTRIQFDGCHILLKLSCNSASVSSFLQKKQSQKILNESHYKEILSESEDGDEEDSEDSDEGEDSEDSDEGEDSNDGEGSDDSDNSENSDDDGDSEGSEASDGESNDDDISLAF